MPKQNHAVRGDGILNAPPDEPDEEDDDSDIEE